MNEFANHYLTEQQFPFSYCVVMEFIVWSIQVLYIFQRKEIRLDRA